MKIAKSAIVLLFTYFEKVVLLFKSAFGPYKIDEIDEIEKCNTT